MLASSRRLLVTDSYRTHPARSRRSLKMTANIDLAANALFHLVAVTVTENDRIHPALSGRSLRMTSHIQLSL